MNNYKVDIVKLELADGITWQDIEKYLYKSNLITDIELIEEYE